MSESRESRPPVAIRIVRPYETDDDLLANELETIGKTSVILLGAQQRPVGVILRFEVTLANGAVALRGEGRVLGHKDQAFRGQPGLALRFTRLDPKSKALVDRATAMREARAGGVPSAEAPAPVSSPSRTSLPAAPPASVRPPSVRPTMIASVPPPSVQADANVNVNADANANADAHANADGHANANANAHANAHAAAPLLGAPADREGILSRLRARSASLSPERVAEILASRPPR